MVELGGLNAQLNRSSIQFGMSVPLTITLPQHSEKELAWVN